jgi:rhodanese-related sulfurtransferase
MMSKSNDRSTKYRKYNNLFFLAAVLVLLIMVTGLYLQQNGQVSIVQASGDLPREVSIAEAARMRSQGAFILDVREPYEWDEIHIPGAKLAPLGELKDRLSELPVDQEIVVVCRSGNRSAVGRDILLAAGFDQVTSMAGGMNQWKAFGLEVVTGP